MKEKLKNLVKEVLKKVGIKNLTDFSIEYPAELSHGDYSSNVALVYHEEFSPDSDSSIFFFHLLF